ncbi:MAG: serpin family protein, partial [Bacilli bacterium]|nr:serpin family protein [Bacilli bacterium]
VIGNDEREAYDSFSNTTYHSLVNTSKQDNMSYSVVGLYSNLNELANASSRDDLSYHFDELLGLDAAGRSTFYSKIMKANSFAEENSTIQLKNAAFFDKKYDYSQTFVNSLAKLYCEAYQLDFEKDASRIVDWVNAAVNSRGFIDKDFLAMDKETTLYLFSTLYFKNAWRDKYLAEDTKEDDFYLANGSIAKAQFMKHSYVAKYYCDFGSYISVKDYYHHGNASVTYLVPKKVEDNIFDLTKDANIFEEKEEYKVYPAKEHYYDIDGIVVNLKTPRFKLKCDVDFKDCLKGLGFESMFSRQVDSFKNAFSGDNLDNVNFYMQNVKQRNEVEFNEDGSIVKSVSMAAVGGYATAAQSGPTDSLDVDLNQPFIYIIRDVNDNPIFVGHVDNPKV